MLRSKREQSRMEEARSCPARLGLEGPPGFEKLEERILLSLLGMGAELGPPVVSYDTTGQLVYDSASDAFDVDAAPLSLRLEYGQAPLRISDPRDFQMHLQIDETGQLVGGVAGDDLVLIGKVTSRTGVVYDGVLLTGEIVEYGELNAGQDLSADKFDFRFTPTGGLLIDDGYFVGYDIGVDLTLTYWPESNAYDGSFTVNFDGHAEGVLGVVQQLPAPEPSSISGNVTADGADGIEGIAVTLTGTDEDGAAVNLATATDADGNWSFADLAPGTYSVSAAQSPDYLDGDETAGTLGGTVGDDVISQIVITGGQDASGYNFNEVSPASVSGLVYEDFNNDGLIDFDETAIEGVTVTLTGTDDRGQAVELTDATDADGVYFFAGLRPGTYTVTETQPGSFQDGVDTLGDAGGVAGNDVFSAVALAAGQDGMNYNFGERPEAGAAVTAGQTATIGFWQNKNGQSLITSLNNGASDTQLGNWLAATFPNMFGLMAGMSNADVANLYREAFKAKKGKDTIGPAKLDSQVMATAFAVYVTNQTLAGTTAASYGFMVTESGVGAATFNVGTSGAAFDVADYTELTVMDILLATDAKTAETGVLYSYVISIEPDGSVIYGIDQFLRALANEVYTAINEAGDI